MYQLGQECPFKASVTRPFRSCISCCYERVGTSIVNQKKTSKHRTELVGKPKCHFVHFDAQSRLEERLSSTERLLTSVRETLRTSKAIVQATHDQVDLTADQLERLDS